MATIRGITISEYICEYEPQAKMAQSGGRAHERSVTANGTMLQNTPAGVLNDVLRPVPEWLP